ncbi:TnsA endonuclease N-terminal domain-containing protein [Sphingomonas sp. AR_OL41]|uniref:TnsA endonuclease N-terminal domain-containing protein n=1 Tax=Sphingomonas sp. AR_OL41 TaxID=3042729 RepID=UPI0024803B22|nr:TnsA endonuclease N-terminal domain-containing protein [Sphingomonas sp. AR_OL41]MDH7973046.1 TnsA endonuclease N-terminal domain-containing protein [Sphingomonas sp. AR_OL41]
MARRYRANTERRIAQLRREGRGQGSGETYLPQIRVSDFSSSGRVHRRPSSKFERVVHLLSDIEEDTFLPFDGAALVADVREQFPLPRDETYELALAHGLRHPKIGGVLVVMTTDMVVDFVDGRRVAVSVKPAGELSNRNTIAKLEIERLYWERMGVAWHLVTEREIEEGSRINNQQLVEWRFLDGCEDGEEHWDARAAALLGPLAKVLRSAGRPRVIDAIKRVEASNGWQPGDGLSALRRLLALGMVRLTADRRFDPFGPVDQLEIVVAS